MELGKTGIFQGVPSIIPLVINVTKNIIIWQCSLCPLHELLIINQKLNSVENIWNWIAEARGLPRFPEP